MWVAHVMSLSKQKCLCWAHCVPVWECEMCVCGDTCTEGWHLLLVCAPESNTITQAWTPAGSWTAWRWRTWTGLTCASTLPATTGWAKMKATTCLWETCWAAQIPWTCQNVCVPFPCAQTNASSVLDRRFVAWLLRSSFQSDCNSPENREKNQRLTI